MLVGDVRAATTTFGDHLNVVWRKAVISGTGERVEVSPRLQREAVEKPPILVAQLHASRLRRLAERARDQRRRRPQRQERGRRWKGDWDARAQSARTRQAPMTGLALISLTNTATTGGPARWAVAAEVSHSSSRRWVTTSRTSVMKIACTI